MIQLHLKENSAQESLSKSQMQMLQDWCLVSSRLCSVCQKRSLESSLITQCVVLSSAEKLAQVRSQVKTTTSMAVALKDLTILAKLVISHSREPPTSSLIQSPPLETSSTTLLTQRS